MSEAEQLKLTPFMACLPSDADCLDKNQMDGLKNIGTWNSMRKIIWELLPDAEKEPWIQKAKLVKEAKGDQPESGIFE